MIRVVVPTLPWHRMNRSEYLGCSRDSITTRLISALNNEPVHVWTAFGKHSFVLMLVGLLIFSCAIYYVTNLGSDCLLPVSKLC
jgi:hypothetical protein